jgi:hypothetical protein
MAIDRCTNLCRTVLVGIYLRNVDEWNTSLHRSRILIRVSARDDRCFTSRPRLTRLLLLWCEDRQYLDFFMACGGALTTNILF